MHMYTTAIQRVDGRQEGEEAKRIPNRDAQFCRSRRSRTPPESRAKPEEDQPGAGRGAVRAQ